MEIEWNNKKAGVPFSSIKTGQVFSDGIRLYIRTSLDGMTNCFCLHNRQKYYFEQNTTVHPVKAKLVVED